VANDLQHIPILALPTSGVVLPRPTPVNGVIGGPGAGSPRPGATPESEPSETGAGRWSIGPMMPAAVSRPSQPSSRSTVRGGRAALWSSQRRRKESDATDKWSVAKGVAAVIEPPDIPDQDPGPGVIGLDR
jgi:hypothetical protein